MKSVSPAEFVKVIEGYIVLTPDGSHLTGYCPACYSAPRRMIVRPDIGLWHCYRCGAGGDLVEFVRLAEQIDAKEAEARIGERLGLTPAVAAASPEPRELRSAASEPPAPSQPAEPALAAEGAPAAEAAACPAAELAAAQFEPLFERLSHTKGFRSIAVQAGALLAGRGLPIAQERIPILVQHLCRVLEAAHEVLGPSPTDSDGFESVMIRTASGRLLLFRSTLGDGLPCHVVVQTEPDASVAMYELVVHAHLNSLGAAAA